MKITTIGIDLAKTTLSVHGVDDNGKVVLRKTMSRAKLLEFMANREPCRQRYLFDSGFPNWASHLTASDFGTIARTSTFVPVMS